MKIQWFVKQLLISQISSLENELGKLEESNKILERLEKENILQSFELEINTKEFKNLQFIIANKFNEMKKNKNNCGPIKLLNNIDYSILTYEIYNSANVAQFSEVNTEHEYMEIIICRILIYALNLI